MVLLLYINMFVATLSFLIVHVIYHRASAMVIYVSSSADPEGGQGSGPPLEDHKLYGFL